MQVFQYWEHKNFRIRQAGIIQAFENVPGVSMDTNGGLGTTTGISVRGLKQKYIGVRLDGMDITDPSNPQTQYDFGGLTGNGFKPSGIS